MNEIEIKIANLAADGIPASKIAKLLKLPRQNVHYYLKKLVKQHILRPVRRTRPRIYEKGDNFYKFVKTDGHVGWVEPKINAHHFFYKFNVLRPPSRPLPWSKAWTPNNPDADIKKIKKDPNPSPSFYKSDIHRVWKMSPGDDFSKIVTIKEDIGAKHHTIMIMMHPEEVYTAEQLKKLPQIMLDRAMQIAEFLQRAFGYQLSLPEQVSQPHYAMQAPEDVVKVAKKYNINVPETWYDESHGNAEIETTNLDVAISWRDLPNTLKEIKEIIEQQQKAIEELYNSISEQKEILKSQVKFNAFLIKTLKEIVENEMPDLEEMDKDKWRDVV